MKSIYFCSSAGTNLFAENKRSSFQSFIDHNYLNDFPNGNIEVGVKTIVFDNKIGMKEIRTNEKVPDIVVFQKMEVDDLSLLDLSFKAAGFMSADMEIDFSNKANYVFYNGPERVGDYKDYVTRGLLIPDDNMNHTGVCIVLPGEKNSAGLMHNIYLDKKILKTKEDFIDMFNNVFKTLPFNAIQEGVMRLGGEKVRRKKKYNGLSIYIGEQLAQVLELHSENSFSIHNSLRELAKQSTLSAEKKTFQDQENIANVNKILDANQLENHRYVQWESDILATKVNLLKIGLLALKSNIADYSIKNSSFDRILAVFDANKLPRQAVQIDFKNPTFFQTTKEKLATADFQIIDTESDRLVNFSAGSPTYIHCLVKKESDMGKTSLKMVLDSSDKESKKLYPQNNNMQFTIKLPERMEFHGDWKVSLKSLFIPSRLDNVYEDKCWMLFKGKDESYLQFHCRVPSGHYETERDLVKEISSMIKKEKKPFKVSFSRSGRPVFTSTEDNVGIVLSSYLAHILGFTADVNEKDLQLSFPSKGTKRSPPFPPNIMALLPRNLIICCDVVDDTIFAGQHVKLLRLVTNNASSNATSISSFDFLQDETFDLKVKEFLTIEINILDVTGEVVLSDSILPTQLQLEFVREG